MNHRIAIVEDDYIFAIDLERNIVSWGYEVVGLFQTGEKFLAEFEALQPTTILMDIHLKGEITGLDVANKIKAKKIPIIYITSSKDDKIYNSVPNANSSAFLVKPFHMLTLKGAIEFQTKNIIGIRFNSEPAINDIWLKKLEEAVRMNIQNTSFTVVELAEMMLMTDRSLRSKLKKNTGFSPNNYIKEARLMKARQLLEDRSCTTISEICYKTGFKTPSYFTAEYKKRFGKLPSEYFYTD